MALQLVDRIRDTTTSGGTGNITVSGTAPTNYRTFSAIPGIATGDIFPYSIVSRVLAEWETGLATYSGSNVISRTVVFASSNAGSLVNFTSGGTKDVVLSINAIPTIINASLFGFLPSASGATNAAAMISALSFLNTLGGGALFVPRGNYTMTPSAAPAVNLTANNIRFLGEGSNQTIITTTLTTQDIISINALNVTLEGIRITASSTMGSGTAGLRVSGDKITVRDFYVYGGPGGGSGGLVYDGIVVAGATNNYWQLYNDIKINLCKHAGFLITGSTGTIALNLHDINIGCFWGTSGNPTSSNATQYGFRSDYTGAGAALVENLQVLQPYDFGISASSSCTFNFVNSGADTCGTDDWNFLNTDNLTFTDCWAGACLGSAGSNQGNGFTLNGCNGVTMHGCTGADINVMFAWIQSCDDVVCIGNRCSWGNQANTGAGAGFYLNTVTNFTISNNIMNNHSAEYGTAGLFRYGTQIDDLAGAGAGLSTYGRVDSNIFHPCQTGTVRNNAASATVTVGTNAGP